MSALISRAEFRHRAEKVALPLRRVSGEEYRKALEIIDNFAKDASDFDYRQNAALHVYAGTIVRYRYQQNHDLYSAEMHFLRLGDVALVSFPFELFLDYGNKIRARSPAASTFLVELCCGAGGYLPTLRAERGGHYSAYASSGKVGLEGGEFLVRHTLEILRDLWYTDKPYLLHTFPQRNYDSAGNNAEFQYRCALDATTQAIITAQDGWCASFAPHLLTFLAPGAVTTAAPVITTAPVTTAPVTTAPVTTAPVTTEKVTTAAVTTEIPDVTTAATTAAATTASGKDKGCGSSAAIAVLPLLFVAISAIRRRKD